MLKAAAKAEAAIREIEMELETMKCCAEIGADFEDADGYARGAMEADKRRRAAEEMTESNNGVAELLDLAPEGNSIIEAGNILGKLSERAAAAAGLLVALGTKEVGDGASVESDYAKLSKAKDFLKDIKERAERGVKNTAKSAKDAIKDVIFKKTGIAFGTIVNHSPVRVLIGGNNYKGIFEKCFLYPGEKSTKYLQDADAVIILPGQKFFAPGTGKIVAAGAIKILDSSRFASITISNSILCVNAFGASYVDPVTARQFGWTP